MALIRKNVDQLRQEGIKNAQKRINEQIFKRTDKHWCFELWYENVTRLN